MLILVPSSEGKRAPERGGPLALETLAFPELTAHRAALLDALIGTSGRPDARERFGVGPSLEAELERNRFIRTLPTAPALELYDGVLHRALDAHSLSGPARRRADASLLLGSALFGLLHPDDPIPPYRLPVGARLLGLPRLVTFWRERLSAVIATASADDGVILDLRAASYRALAPSDPDRTVLLRLAPEVAGGNVALKRARGLAARRLLEAPTEPASIEGLAELLAADWSVELAAPTKRGATWTLSLAPRA
jgi:cytoplasmic iron level regulating protein YaaA (DUF328/UPF0246 family)